MSNLGNSGFGGPEYQRPPPYSPHYTSLPSSTTPSWSAPNPTLPPWSTPSPPANGHDVRSFATSGGRGFAVPIATNGQTVTVVSYNPPQRGCKCVKGILLALAGIIAGLVIFAKVLNTYSENHDENSLTWDSETKTGTVTFHGYR